MVGLLSSSAFLDRGELNHLMCSYFYSALLVISRIMCQWIKWFYARPVSNTKCMHMTEPDGASS